MGIPVHQVDVEKIHAFLKSVIGQGMKALVLNVNIHSVNLALRHLWLREFLNSAQLVFCDGDGVRWGLRILGYEPPPKVTYDRWIWQLAQFCEKEAYRLFFLGGKPGVAEAARQEMKSRFPKLEITGAEHGYFPKAGAENERVIEKINRAKPDILVVGFGMPLQERWLKDYWERIDAHIFLTGGAVFDYVSGGLRRAPRWMIQTHLEWLFRLLGEPRRLSARYLFGIPYFFLCVLIEKYRTEKKE